MVESGPVVVYGLSTEGYLIASSLVSNNVKTTLIDEKLHLATEITSETVSAYSSAMELMEEESLLGMTPMGEVISESKVIFFTPRIRRTGDEAAKDLRSIFSTLLKNITEDTLIFFCIPVGIAANMEIVELAERVSGLNPKLDLTYCYLPLLPRSRSAITFGIDRIDQSFSAMNYTKLAEIKHPKAISLQLSELQYLKETISWYAPMAAELEAYRAINDTKERKDLGKIMTRNIAYLDDMVDRLYDLRSIVSSLDTGEPLLYIASGILRSIDGYSRYLTDELKKLIKERALKASRTKVTLGWGYDRYEMRGEKIILNDALLERIGDLVGDIASTTGTGSSNGNGSELSLITEDKVHLLIICSKNDIKLLDRLDSRTLSNVITMKANLLCDY